MKSVFIWFVVLFFLGITGWISDLMQRGAECTCEGDRDSKKGFIFFGLVLFAFVFAANARAILTYLPADFGQAEARL
jgi:hypothetical protein